MVGNGFPLAFWWGSNWAARRGRWFIQRIGKRWRDVGQYAGARGCRAPSFSAAGAAVPLLPPVCNCRLPDLKKKKKKWSPCYCKIICLYEPDVHAKKCICKRVLMSEKPPNNIPIPVVLCIVYFARKRSAAGLCRPLSSGSQSQALIIKWASCLITCRGSECYV